MLARRGRLNMKPNLAKGSKAQVTQKTDTPSSDSSEKVDQFETKSVLESPDVEEIVSANEPTSSGDVPAITTLSMPEAISKSKDDAGGSRAHETLSAELISGLTSVCLSPVHGVPLDRRQRNMSPPHRQLSMTSPERRKKPRRKFDENEKLDTKKMLMMDMIFWNPREEKGLIRKNAEDVASISDPAERPVLAVSSKVAAPQVKIGDDGNLILDESSLLVEETQNDTSAWDIVDDDRLSKKVTSLSFRNRLWRKGTTWTNKETELFYEILRCTGPDFGLMHEFFPSRARNELKCKFNREERQNWQKISDVMSKPSMLDESLYERAAKMESEIEEEANRKKTEFESKKRRKPAADTDHSSKKQKALIDWDESKADLEKEAHDIIAELERQTAKAKSMESESSSTGSDSDASEILLLKRSRKKRISKAAMDIIKLAEAKTKTRRKMAEPAKDVSSSNLAGYAAVTSTPDEAKRVATPSCLAGYDDGPSTSTAEAASVDKPQSNPVPITRHPIPSIRPVGRLRGRGRGSPLVTMRPQRQKVSSTVTREEQNVAAPVEKHRELEKNTAADVGSVGENVKGNGAKQKRSLNDSEVGVTSSVTPSPSNSCDLRAEYAPSNLNDNEDVSPTLDNNGVQVQSVAHATSNTPLLTASLDEKGNKPSVTTEGSRKLTRSRVVPKLPPSSRAMPIKRKAAETVSTVVHSLPSTSSTLNRENPNDVVSVEKSGESEKKSAEDIASSAENVNRDFIQQTSHLSDSNEVVTSSVTTSSSKYLSTEDAQLTLDDKDVSPTLDNNGMQEKSTALQVEKELIENGKEPSVTAAGSTKLTRSRAVPKLPPASRAIKRKAAETVSTVVEPASGSQTSSENPVVNRIARNRNARQKPVIRSGSESEAPSKSKNKIQASSELAEDLSSGDEEITFIGQTNPVLKALMERAMKSQKKNDDDSPNVDEAGPSNSCDVKESVDETVLKKTPAGRGRGRGRGRR